MNALAGAAHQTMGVARERRQAADFSIAITDAQSAIHDFELELVSNPDYQRYPELRAERISEIREGIIESGGMDSHTRARFDNAFRDIDERNRQTVIQLSRSREEAHYRARLEEGIDRASRYEDPNEALPYINLQIDALLDMGAIDPREAAEMRRDGQHMILFHQAVRSADEIIAENSDPDIGYREALAFARDPDNSLSLDQRRNLVNYIRDQRQDWNVEFDQHDRAFNDEALQAYHAGFLSRQWLLDESNIARYESRQRWIGMLDARDAAREGSSSAGANREASRDLQLRLEDRAGGGEDWFELLNEAFSYLDEQMLDPIDFRAFRNFNEQNNASHPMNPARTRFDAIVDELGMGDLEREELWNHASEQIRSNFYRVGPDGRMHRVADSADRMSNDEVVEMVSQIARGIIYESGGRASASDLGRALENFSVGPFGGGERDLPSVTRMLASGNGARGLIGYPQYDEALREIGEDHERIIRDVFGITENQNTRAVPDPQSGRRHIEVPFEDGTIWTRIGFTEFDENNRPHPRGGEMTLEVYNRETGEWYRVDPNSFRGQRPGSDLDDRINRDIDAQQNIPPTHFGVPLDRGADPQTPTSSTQFQRSAPRETTSPRPERRPGESALDYRARLSMWEAEQQRQGR
ncbi:MAG: hypothetical protein LAT56_00290 [Wenzhouxiangella sp.]|nr:hypothetical protein [Wenzhouxiangella sp.]